MQVGEGLGTGMPQPLVPSVLQGTEQDIRMGSECQKELVKISGAITSVELRLGLEILQKNTNSVKFN
jgi:hypothetical protein